MVWDQWAVSWVNVSPNNTHSARQLTSPLSGKSLRGAHKTFAQRKGFDNRVNGVGTVQLVSPILTQWLAHAAAGPQFETGGVAVMNVRFVPEPGVIAGLVAGVSMLLVLHRFRP